MQDLTPQPHDPPPLAEINAPSLMTLPPLQKATDHLKVPDYKSSGVASVLFHGAAAEE